MKKTMEQVIFPWTYRGHPGQEDYMLLKEHYYKIVQELSQYPEMELSDYEKDVWGERLDLIIKKFDEAKTDSERAIMCSDDDEICNFYANIIFNDLMDTCPMDEYLVLNDPNWKNVDLYEKTSHGKGKLINPYRSRWNEYWEYRDGDRNIKWLPEGYRN